MLGYSFSIYGVCCNPLKGWYVDKEKVFVQVCVFINEHAKLSHFSNCLLKQSELLRSPAEENREDIIFLFGHLARTSFAQFDIGHVREQWKF